MQAFQKILKHTDVMAGVGLLIVVSMLILPLPHELIDLGLVLAIGSSVVILLTSVNAKDPLEFSVFPSLLVVTTLFRLALRRRLRRVLDPRDRPVCRYHERCRTGLRSRCSIHIGRDARKADGDRR